MRFVLLGLLVAGVAPAAQPPLLGEPVVAALASELSGESAKHNLDVISGAHRMRASRGFRDAAQFVAGRLREYGLEEVEILQFPADGVTMFGTQKSRPAWDVDAAELWELRRANDTWTQGCARRALGVCAAVARTGQRKRRRHRRAGRCRQRYGGRRLRREGRARQARSRLGAARGSAGARRGAQRRRRHRELRAEPAHGVVRGGPQSAALGASR